MRPFRSRSALTSPRVGAAGIGLFFALATQTFGQVPPAGSSLSRFVPTKNLVMYAEFDGVEAHAAAWRATAAYKLLNETSLGALIKDLAAQGIDSQAPGGAKIGKQAVDAFERLAAQGFAIGVMGTPPARPSFVIAIRGGARPELRQILDQIIPASAPSRDQTKVPMGTRSVTVYGTGDLARAVWNERGDVVICNAPQVDLILSVLDGKEPSVATSPIRAGLLKEDPGFKVVGLAFGDVTATGPLPPDAAKLGFDGVKRVEGRFGFQNDALLSELRVVAPAPRKGVVALFDQPAFTLNDLPPIPAGLTSFSAWKIDLGKTFDDVLASMKASDPDTAEKADAFVKKADAFLGVSLRRDLLAHLGPEIVTYEQPEDNVDGVKIPYVNMVITVKTDDAEAVGKALKPLMVLANRQLGQLARGPGGPPPGFVRVEGPRTSYRLKIPEGMIPPGPFGDVEPTVIVDKSRLVIAMKPKAAEAALALAEGKGERWKPVGPLVAMAARLPKSMFVLSVNDPRATFPQLVAGLPGILEGVNMAMAQSRQAAGRRGLGVPGNDMSIKVDNALVPSADELAKRLFPGSFAIATDDQGIEMVTREALPNFTSPATTGVLVALLLPAVQSAREAARRAQCVNNMKQIGLAMHNFHSTNDRFPSAAISDKAGKPLLSWRVAILPYIEQQALYNKFKLDEAWDSPHNRALLKEMPTTYQCPSCPKSDDFKTGYLAFVGKGGILELTRGVGLAEITDGTSNTMMAVENKEGVPWTKPDDLTPDPAGAKLLSGAGSFHPGGLNALFADGSVRFISSRIDVKVWNALITRAGGEVVAIDQIR